MNSHGLESVMFAIVPLFRSLVSYWNMGTVALRLSKASLGSPRSSSVVMSVLVWKGVFKMGHLHWDS